MGVYSRPNGTTDFTNDPNVDPATGAKFDAELNGLTSTVNAIDNANIAATPKIDGTKLDLTTTGFLATTGGTMTGTIAYSYDGIWHEYRAAGNAQVRTYRGSDGAEIGWSYNAKWDEGTGAWLGRDIAGTATALKLESSGVSISIAPSGSSGAVPVFDVLDIFDNGDIGRNNIRGINVTPYTAGNNIVVSSDTVTASTSTPTLIKFKEIEIERGGTIRVYYTANVGAGTVLFNIYRNDVAVGTQRAVTGASNWEEDISGWVPNDKVQIKAISSGGPWTATVANFRIKVADYLQNAVTFSL